nr:phage portal protein [Ectothiorhodospira shaposhnikovii]
MESCYNGGREWFDDHIFRYIKEGDGEYKDRVKRAYRFNHTREIVDLVNKYLFKAEVHRNYEDAPKVVQEFWMRATRAGQPIEQYMRQLSLKSSTFGRIWVVVDNTKADGSLISRRDEKKAGIRTYSYFVRPQMVLDMSFDKEQNLNWILIEESARDDADPFDSSGKLIRRFRLWTREYWLLFEEKGSGNRKTYHQIDGAEHGLGVVPVFNFDNIETDDLYSAPALIGDIAYLDRAVANYLSNLDAIIQDQSFSQLAMPAQGLLPGDDAYNKLLEMGTKRVFLFDGEGGSQPFYLSPDVKQAELILQVVKQIINEIYHSVGMAGERTKQDNSVGIDNSSGVAKAYDFERVNSLLASKGDSLDRCEANLVRLVCLWNGEEEPEDLVKYPDSFDVRRLVDEFDISSRLALLEAPSAVRREQMRALVDKLFPRLKDDLRKSIDGELQTWPPKDPVDSLYGSAVNTDTGQDTGQPT